MVLRPVTWSPRGIQRDLRLIERDIQEVTSYPANETEESPYLVHQPVKMHCVAHPAVPPCEPDLQGLNDDLIAKIQDAHERIPELYADSKSQIRFYCATLRPQPYKFRWTRIGMIFTVSKTTI
jgi:hypothetical protein